tara:strand:- start:1412 stop:1684 length:273 start_codon:yes stop_codon:yes gene_type:complete
MSISAHVQFVPLQSREPLSIIDKAINCFKHSGLEYEVGAFGTSIEGERSAIQKLVQQLLSFDFCDEFLLNVQYHVGNNRLLNLEKVSKFR